MTHSTMSRCSTTELHFSPEVTNKNHTTVLTKVIATARQFCDVDVARPSRDGGDGVVAKVFEMGSSEDSRNNTTRLVVPSAHTTLVNLGPGSSNTITADIL